MVLTVNSLIKYTACAAAMLLSTLSAAPGHAQSAVTPTEQVYTPPVCSTEQLEGIAQSAWWSGLPNACVALFRVRPYRAEAPANFPAPLWQSFVAQCDRGAPARFLCDYPETFRSTAPQALTTHLNALAQRASEARELCPALAVMQANIPRLPESQRPEASELIANFAAFCQVNPNARIPLQAHISRLNTLSTPIADHPVVIVEPQPIIGRGEGGIHGRAQDDSGLAGGERVRAGAQGASGAVGSIASAVNPLGGILDIALQGLTQLLVQRAQAELEMFAIDQLRTSVCTPAARPWLESTCEYLGGSQDSTLRVSIGQGLRAAFQSDVLAMPTRVLALFPRSGNARSLVGMLYFDILAGWVETPDVRITAQRVMALASEWEPASNVPQNEPRYAREMAATRAGKDALLAAGIVLSAASHNEAFERMNDSAFVPLMATLVGRELNERDRLRLRSLRVAIAQWRDVGQGVRVTRRGVPEVNLTRAAAALRATVSLINAVMPVACADPSVATMMALPGRMAELLLAIGRGNLPLIVVETARVMAAVSLSFGLPESVVRGLSLAAEVASAQTAEQVRAALDSVIAPVGTWRLKRRRVMFSLGALVGAGGGMELTLPGAGVINPSPLGYVSLTGAVGLDASFPAGSSTLGGFLSVIDVGGLLSLPTGNLEATVLNEDGTTRTSIFDVSPRVSPEQVLSPGLYFRWGIFNSPLVLALGASVTPLAHRIQETRVAPQGMGAMAVSRDVSVFRAGAFLSVDVTLLPF